jgi:hypothetical protein
VECYHLQKDRIGKGSSHSPSQLQQLAASSWCHRRDGFFSGHPHRYTTVGGVVGISASRALPHYNSSTYKEGEKNTLWRSCMYVCMSDAKL